MTRIAVYLTGSIAAYKGIEVVRELQKSGYEVRVGMTKAATKLVNPATLFALTKKPVLTNLWDEDSTPIPHIELADWTELAVVVPASADIIAKMAGGIADDAVSTTLLATAAPKIVVPAMNSHMWMAPATRRNIAQLKEDGVNIMAPVTGRLAEGYAGRGRLPEPAAICRYIADFLANTDLLKNKKVIITAGGTRENIDPVRFIGNRSSGKMGIAIANAAAHAGADVTLIVGQVSVELPQSPQIKIVHVTTTEDLFNALQKRFAAADILIMAAAVADYRPVEFIDHKIKKSANNYNFSLSLTETTDVLKEIASKKRADQLVVGFAAETDDLLQNANNKLTSKNADMIVANNVGGTQGAFGSDQNQVTVLQKNQDPIKWPRQSKMQIANQLIELISLKLKQGD
ncbi:bifunctional phosphopantothenoylcysteine decarboxylase/phosphopantothenate--cysteine ligase CoaBC [Limosilactobacillus sp. STM2_1]|uniref:Coenzyme A biosynthesis bifunctional protein CoaBC n=1 Tax=Limosilactobacillus rudii TaxID=2759755 RepID=A0A7W3UKM3_9LACO|nr:bifunctional phosphopantothenoylcysteine decarboxylase/phosphopantothenate--cysteine ligase CoaBC [Limosilactobacillus rudii]MBB1080165.1 bifunctional phosphopantothenoylcysteine decarboxylase/phosphopantothenate--cysteine ligase CoaBC [Limosilactobacillus rudii]MBB1096680.1 bifunctional phosphopantothenoylcysteine decarboxylase/phosphopantothenate--cysteine ligase CoaBC [Limosilactobacillus rudii]MCD7133653.1 bifunctional phosphopantothenoylcysteine decarboxylase/phosphopantothenate--cystein